MAKRILVQHHFKNEVGQVWRSDVVEVPDDCTRDEVIQFFRSHSVRGKLATPHVVEADVSNASPDFRLERFAHGLGIADAIA
jgi:hypothetical protein